MPSVLPRTSLPVNFFFSHFCAFMAASAAGIGRASARMKAIASSATLMLLAPGAFITTMPRARRGVEVDVVDAGARAGDDPQARRGGDQVARHLRRAAHDERVGVGERRRASSGSGTAGARVDGPLRARHEAGRRRTQADHRQ